MLIAWRSPAPEALARWIAAATGIPGSAAAGATRFDLGGDVLEVHGLRPDDGRDDRLETTADDEAAEPDGRAAEPDGRRPAAGSLPNPPAPARLLAIGLATVDVERFALERDWRIHPVAPDRILAAAAWTIGDQPRLLILEPNGEGRLAASLARSGEGPTAIYLRTAATLDEARTAVVRAGGRATTPAAGPLGRAFAVDNRTLWGPRLVIVESEAVGPGARTMRP